MSDPKSVMAELKELLASVFGAKRPTQGVPPMLERPGFRMDKQQVGPMVDIKREEHPMERLGLSEMQRMMAEVDKPGAMAADFRPATPMTEQEHEAMRKALNSQGRTYRPHEEVGVNPSDIPPGTLFLP